MVTHGYAYPRPVALSLRTTTGWLRKDGRPIGKVMGDAVKESVNSLLMIGGFIILFSVVVRILDMVGIVEALSAGLVARVMAASAVIAWSGFSVHAQVAAVTQGTDIRMGVYTVASGALLGLSLILSILRLPQVTFTWIGRPNGLLFNKLQQENAHPD